MSKKPQRSDAEDIARVQESLARCDAKLTVAERELAKFKALADKLYPKEGSHVDQPITDASDHHGGRAGCAADDP